MTWRRWTAADDMAVAHPAAGETLDDLTARLDRTPDAIVGHRSVLRASGAWRTLAREWLDRQAAS